MKKLKAELRTFYGTSECVFVKPTAEGQFPAIVIAADNRAFYRVAYQDKGKLGIYQECDTSTIIPE